MGKRKTHGEFLEDLKRKQPEIYDEYEFLEEFTYANTPIRFNTKYGECIQRPSVILNGTKHSIRNAVDQTQYLYNRLKYERPLLFDEVWLKDKFTKNGDKFLIGSIYGDCLTTPHDLLRGGSHSIKIAVNKTEYYKNKLKHLQPELYSTIEVIAEYTETHDGIMIRNKYGECFPEAGSLLRGYTPTIETATDKTSYFKNIVKERNLFYKEIEIIGDYTHSKSRIDVMTRYGLCSVFVGILIRGDFPTINCAYDKTEYFINQCREIYSEHDFDFSKVKFLGSQKKVEVFCKTCNKYFKKDTTNLLLNCGCPMCNTKSIKHPGAFNLKTASRNKCLWIKKPCIVYTIKCYSGTEIFYKVGITTRSNVKKRFSSEKDFKYNYSIINEIKTNLYDAIHIERGIHIINEKHSYIPKLKFRGYTECFSMLETECI